MKYIILLSFLFLIPVSQAEVHIEPYGNIGASYSSASKSPFLNYALGARLGYRFLSMGAGLDLFWTHYNTGNGVGEVYIHHAREEEKGFGQSEKGVRIRPSNAVRSFQPFSIGAFVVVDLPFLFNTYGTIFYSFGERKFINHQGYGLKAGASYLSTFHVQLNLELQWSHYICMAQADCLKSKSSDFNILSAMLSLSVPLSTDIFDFDSFGGSDSDGSDSDGSDSDDSDSSEENESEVEM